eukprot:15692-Heterococcus_DN1.PRE.3
MLVSKPQAVHTDTGSERAVTGCMNDHNMNALLLALPLPLLLQLLSPLLTLATCVISLLALLDALSKEAGSIGSCSLQAVQDTVAGQHCAAETVVCV